MFIALFARKYRKYYSKIVFLPKLLINRNSVASPDRTPRPPKLQLPFEQKKTDAGEWAYDHRIGLCVTLIAYLVLAIAFMVGKIVVGAKPSVQGIIIDTKTLAEHEAFLGFLTNLLVERETDVLLIAGDVFDVTNPSAGAQRRFYRFLREANRLNPGLQIVIIAGNHDSAIRLEAPNPLLEELNTSIVGIVGRTDSGEIDLASLVVPLRNRAGEREALCFGYCAA